MSLLCEKPTFPQDCLSPSISQTMGAMLVLPNSNYKGPFCPTGIPCQQILLYP